eukprot:c36567_g1_i1 orf=29-199(-)
MDGIDMHADQTVSCKFTPLSKLISSPTPCGKEGIGVNQQLISQPQLLSVKQQAISV